MKPNASRLESRVSSTLLPALPSSLKAKVIAARKLMAGAIMLEVLKRYQPGGLSEKSALLKGLQSPAPATNAADTIEKLRVWNRSIIRAGELGVTLPDPVLQAHALDAMVKAVLTREAQVRFRIQTWSHQQGLDVKPTQSTVNQFSLLLQAEITTIQFRWHRVLGKGEQ